MVKLNLQPKGENTFKNIIRKAVREELKAAEVVTKPDLRTAVREELKAAEVVTKPDLRAMGFVTKADLKEMGIATKPDLKTIKDDIVSLKDQVLGELQKFREEMVIIGSEHHRIIDLEDKVERLEEIHPQGDIRVSSCLLDFIVKKKNQNRENVLRLSREKFTKARRI